MIPDTLTQIGMLLVNLRAAICVSSSVARRNPALTPSVNCSSPQDMTLRGLKREEKGYLCETGGSERRVLATPPGAWKPATGDAVGGRLVSVAEVELGEDALHVILDRVLADHQTPGDLGVGVARRH